MKKLLIIALALLSVSIVRADEGMWLLSKLKPLNIEKMQQMGFKLTAEDIYDVNKPGIKDAIVGLGNAGRPFRSHIADEQGGEHHAPGDGNVDWPHLDEAPVIDV